MKHHTAPLCLMSVKMKMKRMSQINRHYNSKQVHVGHSRLTLGSGYMIIWRVPEERRTVKCDTQTTAPVHLSLSCCFFAEVNTLMVVDTDWYYHHYWDTLGNGPSPVSDMTEHEMVPFLAITVQMGLCIWGQLTDYWTTMDQFYTSFYSSMLKWDRFLHIFHVLHLSDNRNGIDKMGKSCDKLWKIHDVLEILNKAF
jgi:hypothetical protein